MQAHIPVLLLGAAAIFAGPLRAAESPAQAPAGTQRQLLQPPTMAVPSPITDRFAVRGVFYMPHITTAIRYDNSAGVPGTLASGEDTLGLPHRRDHASVDMMFRMGERHRINASFYKMARSGEEVITAPLRFGNSVYITDDRLVSTMDVRKLDLAYNYSVLRREKFELGVGVALHLLQMDGSVAAPARFVRQNLDVAGPFATLAVDATMRLTRRFALNVAGSYLGGSVDNVEGGYRSLHGDVQFRVRPNLTVGAGFSQTRFKVDSTDLDFPGHFFLRYKGPEAFVRVSF